MAWPEPVDWHKDSEVPDRTGDGPIQRIADKAKLFAILSGYRHRVHSAGLTRERHVIQRKPNRYLAVTNSAAPHPT
jgi:hypothetical protein